MYLKWSFAILYLECLYIFNNNTEINKFNVSLCRQKEIDLKRGRLVWKWRKGMRKGFGTV